MRIAVDVRMHDHKVGRAIGCDEPFLAGEPPQAVLEGGRGLDRPVVGAGAGLGDRKGTTAVPRDRRREVFLLLLFGAELERNRRTPDAGPQPVRCASELLFDDGLLDHGEAQSTILFRVVDTGQSPVTDSLAHALSAGLGQRALAVHDGFQRAQHLLEECPTEGGQFPLALGELQLHQAFLCFVTTSASTARAPQAPAMTGLTSTSASSGASAATMTENRDISSARACMS